MFTKKKSYSVENFHSERTSNAEICDTSSGNSACDFKDPRRLTDDKKIHNTSEMAVSEVSDTLCLNLKQNQKNFKDGINNRANIKNKPSFFKLNSLVGLFYIFLSSISFSLLSVSVKKIPYINSSQLSLIRNIGVFIGALPIAVYIDKESFVEKQDRFLLILRGFASATAYYMIIIAYEYLPLAEVAIIKSSQPIVTTVLARLYLKEASGWILIITLIVNILGILVSVRLPDILFNRENLQINLSYLGGLAAAISMILLRAFSAVFIRKLKHVHFSIALLYAGSIGIIENTAVTAAAFPFVSSVCGWDQILCMLVGILGFTESACYVLGMQKQPAGLASVVRSSLDILILTLFQILIFREYPDNYVICGACFVIISLLIIGLKNWLSMMPEESAVRRKLKCIEM